VYSWDFGDSQYNYTANPNHSYNAAGTYTVCLTVHDSLTLCQNTYCATVTATVGCNNLTASATSTNASACSACDGTVSGSVSGGTSPYSFLWSNSATTASQNNMCGGNYLLTVTDANGCISSTTVTVNCPDSCVANFYTNVSGNTVYIANNSNDTASNVQFQWDFGDATSSNLTSPAAHTYATSGTYTITLIMNDFLNSCTDTASNVVVVGGPASCVSSFSMMEDSFNLSLWYIYPSANGQAPFTYLWDFGDTTTSTQAAPTHNYTYACHHVVCMTITDANSCTSYYCDSSLTHRMTSSTYMQSLVVINPTAGITEQKKLNGSAFPNPVSDFVNVSFNKNVSGIINVTDITGKIISSQKFDGQKTQVDVRALPQGIYNLSLTGGSDVWNEKIVIIR
jgi:PKD repeat protein